jgi:hypothetical protein
MLSRDDAIAAARAAAVANPNGIGAVYLNDCTPPELLGRDRRARFAVANATGAWLIEGELLLDDVCDYACPDYFDMESLTPDQLAGALEARLPNTERDRAAWLAELEKSGASLRLLPQDLDAREVRARMIALGLVADGAAAR